MHSLILRTAARQLVPLILLVSIWMMYRGHNLPGGGFIGGLMAAIAFILHYIANGLEAARKTLRFDPRVLIAFGLTCSLFSGIIAFFSRKPFLTHLWTELELFGHHIPLGTPMLFDFGVYIVVIGVTLLIIFTMSEE